MTFYGGDGANGAMLSCGRIHGFPARCNPAEDDV